MATALFRCDATVTTGSGHVMRCLTIAQTLAERGWTCLFASVEGSAEVVPALATSGHRIVTLDRQAAGNAAALAGLSCDVAVVDGYALEAEYERACRAVARRIMALDDLPNRAHDADLLLDQTLGRSAEAYAGLLPPGARVLAGSRYALLRPQFAAARPAALARRQATSGLRRILVSLGGTDPFGSTPLILDGLKDCGLAVDVIIGGRSPSLAEVMRRAAGGVTVHVDSRDMARLMAEADLAIGAAGTTSWERCCLGLPTLMVVLAENQGDIARALVKAGAADSLGWHAALTPAAVAEAVARLAGNPGRLAAMAEAAGRLVDGDGRLRAAAAIEELAE